MRRSGVVLVAGIGLLTIAAAALAQQSDEGIGPVPRYSETATPAAGTTPAAGAASAGTTAPAPAPSATEHDVMIYRRPGAMPPRTPRPRRTPVPPAFAAHCTATVLEGAFAPTQGVFLDDPAFTTKTPQLLRDRRHTAGPLFRAAMPMVRGRPTVIAGADFYRDDDPTGTIHSIADRNHILLTVRTDCATSRRVKVGFDVVQHDHAATHFEVEPYPAELPVDPPRVADGRMRTVTLVVPAWHGLPADRTFLLDEGPYRITASILKTNGARLGLESDVTGEAIATVAPQTMFVPVTFTPSQGTFALVSGEAAFHAQGFSRLLSDYLPIAPGSLRAFVAPPMALPSADSLPRIGDGISNQDRLAAALADKLSVAAWLAHADRVVGIVDDDDWGALFPEPLDAPETAGLAVLDRTAVVRAAESVLTDAHEMMHTLPRFAWSSAGMIAECGRSTHDGAGLASGLRLTTAGLPALPRAYFDGAGDLLSHYVPGPAIDPFTWINKCTWTHALDAMRPVRQQRVLLVRGELIRQDDGVLRGAFTSFYDLDGTVDVAEARPGDPHPYDEWALAVRDRKGKLLARYPFVPTWRYEDDPTPDRAAVPFSFRLPVTAGMHQVELVAPAAMIADKRTIAPVTPSLRITAPFRNASVRAHAGRVHLAWQGRGTSGYSVYYSVLDSTDDGKTWMPVMVEVQEAHLEMPAAPGKHLVKVVVTDGVASREATVSFSVR